MEDKSKIIAEKIRKMITERPIECKGRRQEDRYKLENAVFRTFLLNPEKSVRACVNSLQDVDGIDCSEDDVFDILKNCDIVSKERRREVFERSSNCAQLLLKASYGDAGAYDKYCKEESRLCAMYKPLTVKRLIFIELFMSWEELSSLQPVIMIVGKGLASTFINKIQGILRKEYSFSRYNIEEALERINLLELALGSTEAMLEDLQSQQRTSAEDAHIQALTAFFSSLNSEKYGCIIDQLFLFRREYGKIQEQNIDLPLEIQGIFGLFIRLIKFISDNKIEPMAPVGKCMEVRACDIESYIYEGTPFSGNDEYKTVKIISPGWVYKEKNILVTRPRVKEVE